MRLHGAVLAAAVALVLTPSCGGSSHSSPGDGDGGTGGTRSSSGSGSGAHRSGGGGSGSGDGGGGGSGSGSHAGDGSGSSVMTQSDGGGGSCLGSSLLADLGKDHLLIGGSMQAATAAMAPFDVQYIYISGGLPDGTGPCSTCANNCTTNGTSCATGGPGCAWWGCWQYDVPPPGDFVRGFDTTWNTASPAQIPMVSYYQILQSSGVTQGAPEVTQAATNATLMARYFADWRFLLQQIGTDTAFLHVEPDFWGFAEQIMGDPTMLPAAVASANATDCGSLPNTIAGMGQCMISMVRKYAPHAKVGLHASAWSTNQDALGNTSASFDVAGAARQTAAFLAACGESSADFVVIETSDRDAGYYQTVEMRNTWWDATNATLPDFDQDFTWVTALTEALGVPALWWQTPLGNSAQNNTANHYQDNRVDYFLSHMSQLAGAHAIGAVFGAGAGDQTAPETDGGNFVSKANAYFSARGEALCQ